MEKDNKRNTPFWDASLPIEKRLDWLLANMTMDEKLKCMSSSAPDLERFGIKGMSVGGEAAHGVEARNDQNNLGAPEPTTAFPQPIGMSASWDTELIKKAGEITGTEARVLYHRHPVGGLSRWAPTIDLERDPRWGRTEEAYGEDPVLTGEMASAYIRGMQGDHPRYLRIASTLKHFYANNTEEGRGWKNSTIDPRNKYELYLEPFRRAIENGGAEGVMTAYNKINGVPGLLNHEVLEILKKQYGLKHAVSDGGAMELNVHMHHQCGIHAQTLAESLKAGVDAMSDNPVVVEQAAREAYELHLITEEDVDRAIRNVFGTKLRLGIYDAKPGNPYDLVTEADLNSQYNQQICKELSRESVILLKNENHTLPLDAKMAAEDMALVGPMADSWYMDWYCGEPHHKTTLRQGMKAIQKADVPYADGYDRVKFYCGDKAVAIAEDGTLCLSDEAEVFIKEDWGEDSVIFRSARTGKYMNMRLGRNPEDNVDNGRIAVEKDEPFDWFVLEIFHVLEQADGTVQLTNRFDQPVILSESNTFVSMQEGAAATFRMEVVENGLDKVISLIKGKKQIVLALGCNSMVNAHETLDRYTIAMPPVQEKMMEEIYKVNPNVVLVMFSNYPYAIQFAKKNIPAIVLSATGSQDMGSAMAETLFGLNAPAGRLNMTWYESENQLPPIDDYDIIQGKRTYRYFDGSVIYPFGYGLTYSAFTYSDLLLELKNQAQIKVSFTVKNTGKYCSDEVAQVYGTAPASRVKKPWKQLLGFKRLKNMAPGESRQVEFLIMTEEFRFYDVISKTLMVEDGDYQIFAGTGSADSALRGTIHIPGGKTGKRDIMARTAADHYDEYENICLVEGMFGFSAATPLEPDKQAQLIYRDCRISEIPEKARFFLKSETGCKLEILLNDKTIGTWEGDSKNYCPKPFSLGDHRDQLDDKKRMDQVPVIYSQIEIALEKKVIELQENATLTLKLSGDAKLCYFYFVS